MSKKASPNSGGEKSQDLKAVLIELKKVYKKVKKVLNDEELDLYIEESIKEELERVYEYYNNVFGIEDMESLYNPNYNYKINYTDLKLEDFELLIKTKRNSWGLEKDLTKEIRKRAKKVKDKYTKNNIFIAINFI